MPNDDQAQTPIPGIGEQESSGNPFKPGFKPSRIDHVEREMADDKAQFDGPSPQGIDRQVILTKELRVGLDAQLQKLKGLPSSRERALSITKIQEAIMWLGMDLKRLNDTRPYPSSYDPSNAKVEPTADGLKL